MEKKYIVRLSDAERNVISLSTSRIALAIVFLANLALARAY